MTILGIHHASIIVSSLAKARSFYEDFLGLKEILQRPDKPFEGVWYAAGSQQIHLIVTKGDVSGGKETLYPGERPHIALYIDDVLALKQKAEAWGLELTVSRSGRPVFFLKDPDGNILECMGASQDLIRHQQTSQDLHP